jgi:hypothetical protein
VLGPVTQGPPTARFLYLNSGSRAGQLDSCWDQRAKVPVTGISRELIETIREIPGARLEARIAGTAPDGGPACATVVAGSGQLHEITPSGARLLGKGFV